MIYSNFLHTSGLAYPSTPDSDFESNKKSPMDEKERFQKEFDESPHFPRDKSKYTDAGGKKIFLRPKNVI